MEPREVERQIIALQARARGFLVRADLASVRREYETIVEEIEGELSSLRWSRSIIPFPYFTDNTEQRYAEDPIRPQQDLTDGQVPERDQSLQVTPALVSLQADEENQQSCELPSSERTWDSNTDSTSMWDSTTVDVTCDTLHCEDYPLRSRLQDVPRCREALRLHRNSLAMELLWLQQAISSRKKYLLLKQKLT